MLWSVRRLFCPTWDATSLLKTMAQCMIKKLQSMSLSLLLKNINVKIFSKNFIYWRRRGWAFPPCILNLHWSKCQVYDVVCNPIYWTTLFARGTTRIDCFILDAKSTSLSTMWGFDRKNFTPEVTGLGKMGMIISI